MTDIDRRRLINPALENGSSDANNILPQNYDHMGNDDSANKRKKYYIIGGIIAILAILGLVLGLTLGGGGDTPPGPDPGPIPPGPIPKDGFNPYHVDESSIVDEQSRMTGVITTGNGNRAKSAYDRFERRNG